MAFTIKQFNDLRGILFLMLMTIPSIATTNIDCNGKPFHCVNSTHFMICVDLGAGVSETIDDFIIPCPTPTECHNTNRFECEYPAATTQQPTTEPVVITTDQPTTATVQVDESTVQFVPEILTTVPEDLYNTVSTTTLSGSELSTPNPKFMTDTTIDVFNTVNVSTSGSHSDLEVGGINTEVLYTTTPILDVFSETTVSPGITDFAVESITDNTIILSQTDRNINTTNKITTVSPGITDFAVESTTDNPIIFLQTDSNINTTNKITTVSPGITDFAVESITDNTIILSQTDRNINTTNKITTVSPGITDFAVESTTDNPIIFLQTDSNINTTNKIITVSPRITDFAVKSTTDNAIVFSQTDIDINTTNNITTVNLDVEITTTAENKLPAFTTTEHVNLIIENKTEINYISELVTENINATSSIQNQAEYTTESLTNVLQVENNEASIIKIPFDQLITANNQDQSRSDLAKETTVTFTNPLENVLINTENTKTTLSDVPKDHTDVVIKQTTETNASIPSDLSVPTESIILVEPKSLTETTVLVDQENQLFSVDRGIVEKTLHITPKTNTKIFTQDATADYYFGNMAKGTIGNRDVITGPSSELHNAVISSTAPTIDTTFMAETTISQDAFYSIKTTSEISTTEPNVITDKVITNNNNIVDNIITVSLPSTDSPTLTTVETTSPTATNIDTTLIAETKITQDAFYSLKVTSDANVMTVDDITTVSLLSTDFPSLTTDDKSVSTKPSNYEYIQNETVVHSLKTNLKSLSDNSTLVTTEKELKFNLTVTKHAVNETNINFISNVVTQPSKLESALQQLEVSNKPDSDTNVSNSNTQHNILSNIDLSATNIKTEKIITEPTFTETEKKTGNNDVNPTVTQSAISESDINFVSNVVLTQPSELDPALQQLEVSNKPDSDTNVSNLNTQHNILSNVDLSADNIKTETIITEFSFTETEKKTANNNVNPTVTKPAISESDVNFGSNVVTLPSKLDPTLQQLEVSNKPDSDTNLNTQHNILSNIDLSADNIKTETIITEPTFTETEKNIGNNDVNTRIQLVEHYTIIPQSENEKPRLYTTESSTDKVQNQQSSKVQRKEKATTGQVIESTVADDNLLNSENKNKIDSITNAGSSILLTEATAQYYDVTESIRKADQFYTVSETNTIIDMTNEKAPDFILDKTISELRKNEPTAYEIPSIAQNEQTKTQLLERVEINTLQKATTETIHYSPTAAADGKLVGTESTILENEQYKIKPIVIDTTASENQLTLAPTESVLELNPTVTDSAVSESNLFFESSVNVQLPKSILTKSIDIINNQILNAPDTGSEKSNKVEAKGYETLKTPITETPNTKQQKETKTISDIAHNIAKYGAISKLPVTESTHVVDFNQPSGTISSDPILQLTTSPLLDKTEEIISASKFFEAIDSTKSIIENSPGFIKIKNDNSKYYSTGDLTTRSTPTISISENLDNKATPLNQIVKPTVHSLGNLQYNPNIKSSEGFTILQTPNEQMTIESKFESQHNIANINENSQDNKNTVANIVVPINSNKLSFKTENVKEPNNREISIPISEKAVVNLTSSSTTEKQEILPEKFHVITHNTTYINHEPALSESVNNNKKDVIIGTTNNGLPLPKLSSKGDLSVQNTYIDKHFITDPNTKDIVPKQLNNAVVNEAKITSDIINHILTSYNDTKVKIIPAEFATVNELINKSFGEFNNKTSTDNSSNLAGFNKSDTSAPSLTVENTNQNSTVGSNTILSEAKIQTRNKLDGNSSVELVKTGPIQTSAILNIIPVPVNITFTSIPNILKRKKDQTLNSEAVLSATETWKSLQTVSGDNNVSKVSETGKNNGAENTHSSIVSSKDGLKKNVKKAPEARVKSIAERDVSTTSNKLSTIQVESINYSQKVNNNVGEAVNLAPFDLLSSARSGGFEEKNNKPSTEKPEDEETIESGNEGNSKINKESSFTTLSSENVSVTTESVEVDNNGSNNNNIVQSNSKYETLTSKPTIEISTRPTQGDNLKNIHLPIVSEVSTQSTVRSTSQKLSLENNTPLPATTKAITNDIVCQFNQRGRFADKHDCRKFYICHGIPQPLVGICPLYTVFSELRKQCTKNLSHCVRNNQFQCVSEGRFSDFLNDSIYYICAKNKLGAFIRFKLRCQNGYHLNKTSVRCVLNTESSQSISSDISKSNSEQSAALKVEVKSKDSSKNKLECKKEGTFADPDNCRVYYVCKKTSKSGYLRKKKKCDSDEYFHKDKKKCVDAESYECK